MRTWAVQVRRRATSKPLRQRMRATRAPVCSVCSERMHPSVCSRYAVYAAYAAYAELMYAVCSVCSVCSQQHGGQDELLACLQEEEELNCAIAGARAGAASDDEQLLA